MVNLAQSSSSLESSNLDSDNDERVIPFDCDDIQEHSPMLTPTNEDLCTVGTVSTTRNRTIQVHHDKTTKPVDLKLSTSNLQVFLERDEKEFYEILVCSFSFLTSFQLNIFKTHVRNLVKASARIGDPFDEQESVIKKICDDVCYMTACCCFLLILFQASIKYPFLRDYCDDWVTLDLIKLSLKRRGHDMIPKPTGSLGKPGSKGYSLQVVLGWDEIQFHDVQVCHSISLSSMIDYIQSVIYRKIGQRSYAYRRSIS